MKNYICIYEKNTGKLLHSCSLENEDQSHRYASFLEKLNIEFLVSKPSLPESLGIALNFSTENLKKEIEEELNSHTVKKSSQ